LGHVIFTDETKVELYPKDLRKRIRRPMHKRFQPRYVVHSMAGKGPSLMFWGCISLRGQGTLFKIIGVLNGKGYGRILRQCIPRIIRNQNLRGAILQEDNAPIHKSNIANQIKEELSLTTLDWPPCSPDLNPIEGIWSYWKDQVRRRLPSNTESLERLCLQEWARIPLTVIQANIHSIPKRLEAVVKAKGGETKY